MPDQQRHFYGPEELRRLIARWEEIESLAEGKLTSYLTLIPYAKGRESDRRYWAAVKADIDSAVDALDEHAKAIVRLRMRGEWIDVVAKMLHRETHGVRKQYNQALVTMAMHLGWEPPVKDD